MGGGIFTQMAERIIRDVVKIAESKPPPPTDAKIDAKWWAEFGRGAVYGVVLIALWSAFGC